MKTLLVDNYDSFSYNLFQFIAEVNGSSPEVIRNDSVEWDILKKKINLYDCIVISPGPGISIKESDFGICQKILKEVNDIPVLGVCLGHQGMAESEGGKVVHAPYVAHGVLTEIRHDGSALFDGIPIRFRVIRYHSWIVDPALPSNFDVTAVTNDDDQLVMAIQHRKKPFYGVQFHPESIATEFGINIIRNFMNIVKKIRKHEEYTPLSPLSLKPINIYSRKPTNFRLLFKKLPLQLTGEEIYLTLCEKKSHTFWLDSSRVEKSLSRFSFIGNTDGPHSFVIYYDVHGRQLTEIRRRRENGFVERTVKVLTGDFFSYLKDLLDSFYCTPEDLPFEFQCGLVGYLGYEMSKECGHVISPIPSSTPDAAYLFVDRLVVLDHQEGHLYIVTMVNDTTLGVGEEFILQMEQVLKEVKTTPTGSLSRDTEMTERDPISFRLDRDYNTYLADIQTCLKQIDDGESYELCLTNKIRTSYKPENPLDFYLKLRKKNSAPFSSFLQFDNFCIASSSPERFLSISRRGDIEVKPIKGTLPRGATAEEDEILRKKLSSSKKDFSENIMILDLMRNDIGMVCQIGSVHVPSLMVVESYASVHQLVSTVRGKSLPHITPPEILKHVFPPGSMTGAPKIRSVQILQTCEKKPRGIYSGVIGFLSVTQACDLNVVIRTAVIEKTGTSIGCGGAIVAASDPVEEFWEMALKASALVHTLSGLDNTTNIFVEGVPGPLRRLIYRNSDILPPPLETKEAPSNNNVVFQLLETMLFEPEGYCDVVSNTDMIGDTSLIGGGFFLLRRHLQRLKKSADFFRFGYNEDEILSQLTEAASKWCSCMRVRLLLSHNGKITVQSTPLTPLVPPGQKWCVRLANLPVDSSDVFLRNKTTLRKYYDDMLSEKGSANDVLLWNEKKEITETCFANIAVRWSDSGTWFTPPVGCGLLAGTMREELLEKGIIKERVITVQEVLSSHEIILLNSVRRCFPAHLIKEEVQ